MVYIKPFLLFVGITENILVLITLNAAVNRQRAKINLFLSAKAIADIGFEIFALLHNVNVYDAVANNDDYNRFYYHGLQKVTISTMNWLLMSSTW